MAGTGRLPDTLEGWLAHLSALHPRTIELGLARVRAVAGRMGLAFDCPVVTIAGTNGKGSTAAMLASILEAAGYRTGLYTSPHLLRYNERVRVTGRDATDAELMEGFAAVEAARGDTALTYFEFGTLAALWQFARAKLDALVLEVGLGGRLDAVNIVDADVAVITRIGIDHVDWLGDTRDKIGFEKAGIFRAGRPAVIGERDLPQSVLDHASATGTPLVRIGVDYDYRDEGSQWRYRGPGGERFSLPPPALRGTFQLANAATALAVLDLLRERLPVASGAVRAGLVGVTWPARFQVLPGRPTTVLDVAHNPQAAEVLARTLGEMGFHPSTYAVYAALTDKDVEGVASAMRGRVDRWFLAPSTGERGLAVDALARRVAAAGVDEAAITRCESIADAWSRARAAASDADRIVVFGSFVTVAAVLDAQASALPR